ncbi:MAG: M23 family metallopeptidase [Syntrophales bacterium]
MKKMKSYSIVIILAVILAAAGAGFMLTIGEIWKPTIHLKEAVRAIGRQKTLTIDMNDRGQGVIETSVSIIQDNRTQILASIKYPKSLRHTVLSVPVDPVRANLHDGPAELVIRATDASVWKNEGVYRQPVRIDFLPPRISVMNTMNHINPGGTCVIVYQLSKPVTTGGVQVRDTVFPSYPITIGGRPYQIAYFAMPIDATDPAANPRVIAVDEAGNQSTAAIPFMLLKKNFRSDKMELGESFLQWKMPDFQSSIPELRGKSLIDTFFYVNTTLRETNERTIRETCKKSAPQALWQDTFLRMKNASPMALYGDRRAYIYGGKMIGESIHLGVDLASTANAPVEAANNGQIVFAAPLGIYGNAVIIDHGLGVFSLYGHMSEITVKHGQSVRKGDVIGHTGTSGLAGGDHLHFSVLIDGHEVNPTEWWDPHWIADNVTKKMAVTY